MRLRRLASRSFLVALASLLACSEAERDVAEGGAPASQSSLAAMPGERIVQVETHQAVLDSVPAVISASGSIRARRVTALGAEVAGRLDEVLVEVGDLVAAGEPLFQIDPIPYRLALDEARAGLALARAEAANAVQEAKRVGELVQRDAVSARRHDQLRTEATVAGARVTQMEARVARAERDLERTTVLAPYAGSIVERLAHEGAMAGPQPIVVVQESGALEAALDIPEAAPAPVRPDARVRLFAEGRATPIETHVTRVSDRVDSGTRTYEIRCPVEDAEGVVKAGSYVWAEVHPDPAKPRPVVDRSALVARDGRTFVFRVIEGYAEQVPVRLGVVGSDRAEILSGIAAGDEIVRGESADRVADGDRVESAAGFAAASAVSTASAASSTSEGSP